jgi:hypothetical protein
LAPTCIYIISNLNKPPSNAGRRSYRQGHFYFTGHENTSYGIVSMHNMERKFRILVSEIRYMILPYGIISSLIMDRSRRWASSIR